MPDPSSAAETLRTRADAVIKGTSAEACYDLMLVRAFALAIEEGEEGEVILVKRRFQDRFKRDFQTSYLNTLIAKELTALRAAAAAANDSPYLLTSTGTMQANLFNAMLMMKVLPLAWDSFACRAILTGPSPWGPKGWWTNHDDSKAAEWMQEQHLNVDKGTAADAADALARGRNFHPVVNYLESLEWDGEPRLDYWMWKYLGTPDTGYTRAVSAKWPISAVKRAYEPGCQADYTLVLEGAQGRRKSTALRILGGGWFSDDVTEMGTKDSAMQLQGKWIVELAELDAFKRAEMTTIKAFLVRREDHFRPPYGRRAEDFPRQNVFAATTNKDDWGLDDTGLRRFWPVRVGNIDIAGLAEVRDQLWAEAVARYKAGESIYFGDEMEAEAALEQLLRQDVDAWRDMVEEWIDNPVAPMNGSMDFRSRKGRIYLPDILNHCLHIVQKDWNHGHKLRVSRILTLAGYIKKRTRRADADEDGKRPEYWVPMRREDRRQPE